MITTNKAIFHDNYSACLSTPYYLELVRDKKDCFVNQKSFQSLLKDMLSNHSINCRERVI